MNSIGYGAYTVGFGVEASAEAAKTPPTPPTPPVDTPKPAPKKLIIGWLTGLILLVMFLSWKLPEATR